MNNEPQVEEFLHEHELPRKRRKAYDDINTPYEEGGVNDERSRRVREATVVPVESDGIPTW